MRLKLFRAATMAQAITQVRLDLGPDALILSSQSGADGVELTAAIEDERPVSPTVTNAGMAGARTAPAIPAFADAQFGGEPRGRFGENALPDRLPEPREPFVTSLARWPPPRTAPPRLAPGWERRVAFAPDPSPHGGEDEQRLHAALAWHGVPVAIARRLCAGPLPSALAAAFQFASLDISDGAPPLFMVGPSGAGKTMTTARLAARLVIRGIHPLVVTSDGDRAGAAEQLAAFTRLLGLELFVAQQPAALAHAVRRRERGEPVLIDSAGADPFDRAQAERIAALAQAAGAVSVLVLPSGLDAAEAGDLACGFKAAGASLLVANRIDVYRRLGGVLAAADTGLAFAEAGIGPGAADGLTALSPVFLADRLLQLPDRAT